MLHVSRIVLDLRPKSCVMKALKLRNMCKVMSSSFILCLTMEFIFHVGAEEPCQYIDCPRTGRFGDRIGVGVRFSAPVQTARDPHSLQHNGYRVSFPRDKAAEAWR